MKIGRNDPCPCGSGKKYKRCCSINLERHEFEYRRQRQIEEGLVARLFEFASAVLAVHAIEDAWFEFNGDVEVDLIPPDDPMNMVFMPWFFFNWVFEFDAYINPEIDDRPADRLDEDPLDTTIAELFLATYDEDLTPDERSFLKNSIQTPFTFCEVLEVKPGSGMKLRDLLRERVYDIVEHSASQSLKRGEILYCAPTEFQEVTSNLATSPYSLRAISKVDVLNFRKELLGEIDQSTLSDDDLLEFEDDFRGLYLDLFTEMFAPPHIVNTDGDDLIEHKVYFDLDSVEEAFDKLKELAGKDQDVLIEQPTFKGKRIIAAEIPWLGCTIEAQKKHGGPILLGLLNLENDQLIAEVNSTDRAEQIKLLVEERLGEHARYKTTLISPMEGAIEELWDQRLNTGALEAGPSGSFSGSEDFDPDSPELHALLNKLAEEHWTRWYDDPVPALNDMTPREAATTPEGRDLLESLLLYYESESKRRGDDNFNPDVAAMRRELGME
ncbi:MAG TPA: SEC-C metal-binding domain-containing protein [Pyrinomonadaceae bacterium]|jgi:hypothetical protein|nr:SEC-C metal-binding domain-containing protein [Pyrinomonadaceae bacterium]